RAGPGAVEPRRDRRLRPARGDHAGISLHRPGPGCGRRHRLRRVPGLDRFGSPAGRGAAQGVIPTDRRAGQTAPGNCNGGRVCYNVACARSVKVKTRLVGGGGSRSSMRTLADIIEEHIRSLVERSGGAVVIQRAELAERFRCVPSQISYVIDTRFTPERGYIVESRRGGGGYIRIIRVASHGRTGALLDVLAEQIGDYIDQRRAENIIERLRDDGLINPREAALLRGAVRRESIPVQLP